MTNTSGGVIETKEIGLRISDSGTYDNAEFVDGKLALSKVDETTYHKEGSWNSDTIDLSDGYINFGKLFATYSDTDNASIALLTRTSNDGITFDEWIAVGEDGSILSEKKQFIQVKINLFAGYVNQEVVISNFDNVSEKDKFVPNKFINTENGLKLEREYIRDMELNATGTSEGNLYKLPISRDEWSRIDKLEVLPSDAESKSLFVTGDGSYKYVDVDYDSPIPTLEVNGLTNYFGFDEVIGNVTDSKGTAVGTIYNAPTRVVGWNGQGYAMSFNGVNQYVQFNSKLINNNATEFSIRLKLKTTFSHPTAIGTILDNRGASTAPHYGLLIYFDKGVFSAQPFSNGVNIGTFNTSKNIADGLWHDVLTIFDNGNLKIYVDDMITPDIDATVDVQSLSFKNNMSIGRISDLNSYFFNGEIDSIEIYNKALTPYDLYESRKWELEPDIQNGSLDKIPNRQLTSLPSIPMEVKSGILSEDDNGILYEASIDLEKYSDILTINKSNAIFHKDGKFIVEYTATEPIIYNLNNMTSNIGNDIGIPMASGEYNNISYGKWRAFDGVYGELECWLVPSPFGWLGINFKNPSVVNYFEIYTARRASTYDMDAMPVNFYFEASNDFQNWSELGYFSNQSWTTVGYKSYNVENNKEYSFYRIRVLSTKRDEVKVGDLKLGRFNKSIYVLEDGVGSDVSEITGYAGNTTSPSTQHTIKNYVLINKTQQKITRKPLTISSSSRMAFLSNGEYYTSIDGIELIQIQESEVSTLGFANLEMSQSIFDVVGELPIIAIENMGNEKVVISTTTKPFTIYDEFGDYVDIIHYDLADDETTHSLSITANWTPLDELEGDFEVVTLAEDSTPRQLLINAIPTPQFIQLIEDVNINNLPTFNLVEFSTGNSQIKYVINKDGQWYTCMHGAFVTIDVTVENNVKSLGITTEQFNSITPQQWLLLDTDLINIGIYLEDGIRGDDVSILSKLAYSDIFPLNTKEITKSSFYILNTTARIDVTLEGTVLRGILSDADLGRVQYRVLLNGQPYRHSETNVEGWNELSPSPYNINMNLYDTNIININANNIVRIEFHDAFGTEDSWEGVFYAKKVADKFTYAFII